MEKKSSNIFSNSASMRELKNRNSLAMLNLRKEMVRFEEQKKFVVTHMEKDRVIQFQFLKDIRVCGSNLNPQYHRLVEGKLSKDLLPNGVRKSRKNVQTAPPGIRTGNNELSGVSSGAIVLPRPATTAIPRHMKTQMELIRNHRRKRPTSHEQAEDFLKKLREKEEEDDLLLQELSQFNIERILLARIQKGESKVQFPSKVGDNLQSGQWAGPREPGFYSFLKSDNIQSQSKESSEFKPRTLHGTLDSGIGTKLAEHEIPLRFDSKQKTSSGKHSSGIDAELEESEVPYRSSDQMSRRMTSLIGDDPFDLSVLSEMTSGKRSFRCKPVELRIHEFLDKLEVMKREQDIRLQPLPFGEKRRRWIALTRGIGAVLALSRKKADKK